MKKLLMILPLTLCAGCFLFFPNPAARLSHLFDGTVEYGELKRHSDALYELEVKKYDYLPMQKALNSLRFVAKWAACSGCRNGNFHGRNFDWLDDDTVEYVLRTPRAYDKDGKLRHATIGIASPIDIGLGIPAKPESPDEWGILPFMTMDGINDAGLVAQINVVPDMDCGISNTDRTRACTHQQEKDAAGKLKTPLSYIITVRTILDYCTTVDEAIELIKGRNMWGLPGLEAHFLVSDAKESVVIEFVDNKTVVLRNQEVMTNFYISEWKRVGQHTPHAFGIERYRYLSEDKDKVDSSEKMLEHMKKAWYGLVYYPGQEKRWASEMNGDFSAEGFGDMTIYSPWEKRQKCFDWYRAQMMRKGPHNAGSWHTIHSSVYDIKNRTLKVCVKENDEPFDFAL